MADWKDEVLRLDIGEVARQLGISVAPAKRWPLRAICPFHNDSDPSLHLYKDPEPHYHCFVCQAHGDIVELVKEKQRVDFKGALDWLATTFQIGSLKTKEIGLAKRQDIIARAFEFWRANTASAELKIIAAGRKLPVSVLRNAGLTVGSVEAFLTSLGNDREAGEDAIDAGIAYPPENPTLTRFQSFSRSPFVSGTRLLIPLRNARGRIMGVMARQLVGNGPKYRFTAGFRKSEVLYRSDHVRRLIEQGSSPAPLDGRSDCFDLFICEGVFDALRLESLGLPAVAILGATISDAQLSQIGELSELAMDRGRVLRAHLFLDADSGGRRGTADGIPRLLTKGVDTDFIVDVVGIDRPEEEKADPDSLLRSFSQQESIEFVRDALVPAIDAVAAISLGCQYNEVLDRIDQLDPAGSIILQNRLARRLKGLEWPIVWRKLNPDRTTLSSNAPGRGSILSQTLDELAKSRDGGRLSRALPRPFDDTERTEDAPLLHAMVLARESTDSREYPVDVATWERIEQGAQLFLPLIEEELAHPSGPTRPYLAHFEPKDSGAPRLKCGPCPEDAIQQQYILTEILRSRPERTVFGEQIPAVRYWADHPHLIVTGNERPKTAVSFAYQIDMRALEERPNRHRRRDMFRPFLDCWNSFILHIGNRIDRMRSDLIYIARLDIKGFYDNVPRHTVEHLLETSLPDTETLDAIKFAPLFGPDLGNDRRSRLIEWILNHSFGPSDRGYCYHHPGNGMAQYMGGIKGLPQGPALSSYLANIVLFGLDSELETRVSELDADAINERGAGRVGGLYARYVDDIIIAARTAEDLVSLRNAVEGKLETLGLELNEKSELLEPMTAEEARNWVVERRGAGFVAYGDVEDQPSPAPDVRSSWSDIPSLDRRTALSLLYWSALDDPEQTSREELEEMLDSVARAEGLRSADINHISKRVALRAALDMRREDVDVAPSAADFTDQYIGMMRPLQAAVGSARLRVRPQDLQIAEALSSARFYLAALAGIERLILGSAEANPSFSMSVRRRIGLAKREVQELLLNGCLLHHLRNALIPENLRAHVNVQMGAQLDIAAATLEERAAGVISVSPDRPKFKVAPRHPSLSPGWISAANVRIGWFRRFYPDGLLEAAKLGPMALFHSIAAGVQVESGRLTADPSMENLGWSAFAGGMSSAAATALQDLNSTSNQGPRKIAQAFRALAGNEIALPADLRMRTLSSFISLSAGPLQAAALQRRAALLGAVANAGSIIPVPPIAGQPGIFCYLPDQRMVRAFVIAADDFSIEQLPLGLIWKGEGKRDGIDCWSATLPIGSNFLLSPVDHTVNVASDLKTIANVFDGLLKGHGTADGRLSALTHVFSLVGPIDQDDSDTPYVSVAWRLPQEVSAQLIFERRGPGIVVQRSPHAGAQLWRIGQSVSDLFSIVADGADDGASLRLTREILQDRLKRMAFSRLRGKWINPIQVAAALASQGIPRSLTRIVRALRESAGTEDSVGPLTLEFFLSGRAMRSRMQLGSLVDTPGGWSRFLETVGSRVVSAGDDETLFSSVEISQSKPRTYLALHKIAGAITRYSTASDSDRCRCVLMATSFAFELNAFRQEVRDTVLAAIVRMTSWDRELLASVRPDLGRFGGAAQIVLIEPRFLGEESQPEAFDLEEQSRRLFSDLMRALQLRALPGRAALDRITTAGWLTVLGVMAGVVDFVMAGADTDEEPLPRPAFFGLSDTELAVALTTLATEFVSLRPAEGQDDTDSWPWEIAGALDVAGLKARMESGSLVLAALRSKMGLRVDANPKPLRMLKLGDKEVEFITDEGDTFKMPWWRVSVLTAHNERVERAETSEKDERLVHPFSRITEPSGRPLILQVLSEGIAALTGLKEWDVAPNIIGSEVSDSISAEDGEFLASLPEIDDGSPERENKHSVSIIETIIEAADQEEPLEDLSSSILSKPPLKSTGEIPGVADSFGSLRENQRRSWIRRGQRSGLLETNFARLAILQYDFIDSYYPEKFPIYHLGDKQVKHPRISAGAVDYQLSFEEHRRRKVLQEVLSTCSNLGVEALVLPEYALAPETITWVERLCSEANYKMSIWAGTFRQQSGFSLKIVAGRQFAAVAPDDKLATIQGMDTVLAALFRETQPGHSLPSFGGKVQDESPIYTLAMPDRLATRYKKYPSIGMNEEFRPHRQELDPMMLRSRSLNRVESFITELVCSELFVFNGPLNWVNFKDHLEACVSRYNLDYTDWMDEMVQDSRKFAIALSGTEQKPRRSILFLTCATSRDVDYHYFAQSAYLASGLVTAFCNSSGSPARGGSCFVGLGGWESEHAGVAPNPYHGAAPGILSMSRPSRAVLGVRERALIVADVKPDRTVEDRPRPQTVGAPMRLIAHIPIIEAQISTPVKGHWSKRWYEPVQWRLIKGEKSDDALLAKNHEVLIHQARSAPVSLAEFSEAIQKALQALHSSQSTARLSAKERRKLIQLALSLAATFDTSPGMRERAEAMVDGLVQHPEPLPCPALLDWMVIDLDVDGFEEVLSELAAVKTTRVTSDMLSGNLRDAPYRWIAPAEDNEE